jgi:TPR repeat protein
MYLAGEDVPANPKHAMALYRKGAALGDDEDPRLQNAIRRRLNEAGTGR